MCSKCHGLFTPPTRTRQKLSCLVRVGGVNKLLVANRKLGRDKTKLSGLVHVGDVNNPLLSWRDDDVIVTTNHGSSNHSAYWFFKFYDLLSAPMFHHSVWSVIISLQPSVTWPPSSAINGHASLHRVSTIRTLQTRWSNIGAQSSSWKANHHIHTVLTGGR